jgi:hypothetical protein
MTKQDIVSFVATQRVVASYSGKNRTWYFSRGGKTVERPDDGNLTVKKIVNSIKKLPV